MIQLAGACCGRNASTATWELTAAGTAIAVAADGEGAAGDEAKQDHRDRVGGGEVCAVARWPKGVRKSSGAAV